MRRGRRAASLFAAVALGVATAVAPATPAGAAEIRKAQWHLNYLHIADAQKLSTGKGVVVAVVDSGVFAAHPDLTGQIVPGADLVGGTNDGWADENSHGTGMAGLIVAKGGGPTHAYGIATDARVLPVRVTITKEGTNTALARGIRAAADAGAKVISISLGYGTDTTRAEREAVAYAASKDAVVVAAAGNTEKGESAVSTPAKIPGVVAVTGLDRQGSFWSGSVQGAEAVIAAPSKDIVTTGAPSGGNTGYDIGSGTSPATAIVAAVIALIRAKYSHLDAANVINRLIRTADDAGPPGRDPQYGFGRVNPVKALTAEVAPVTANPLGAPPGTSASPTTGATTEDPAATAATGGTGNTVRVALVVAAVVGGLALITVALTVALLRRRRQPTPGQGFEPY